MQNNQNSLPKMWINRLKGKYLDLSPHEVVSTAAAFQHNSYPMSIHLSVVIETTRLMVSLCWQKI